MKLKANFNERTKNLKRLRSEPTSNLKENTKKDNET